MHSQRRTAVLDSDRVALVAQYSTLSARLVRIADPRHIGWTMLQLFDASKSRTVFLNLETCQRSLTQHDCQRIVHIVTNVPASCPSRSIFLEFSAKCKTMWFARAR